VTGLVNPGVFFDQGNRFNWGKVAGAKSEVSSLLQSFGWKDKNIIDLGDISSARGTEQLLPIWVRLMGTLGTPMFNFSIVK